MEIINNGKGFILKSDSFKFQWNATIMVQFQSCVVTGGHHRQNIPIVATVS